jgi:hypothetical protein
VSKEMQPQSNAEQEIKDNDKEELRSLFLTATIVVIITVILAPGNFTLLSTSAGIVLLLVLFFYCMPTSKAATLNFIIFSAICALALVLALGFFLNGLYPDKDCVFHPINQWQCVLVPAGNYDLIQTTWGDIAAFVIWGFGTLIFLKWGRKIASSIGGWVSKLGKKVLPDLE